MEKYIGVIEMRLQNVGSKSERYYTFLKTDNLELELSRNGYDDFKDDFFLEYIDNKVEVKGNIIKNRWLLVDSISLIKEDIIDN